MNGKPCSRSDDCSAGAVKQSDILSRRVNLGETVRASSGIDQQRFISLRPRLQPVELDYYPPHASPNWLQSKEASHPQPVA